MTAPEPAPTDQPFWAVPNVIYTHHVSGKFSLPKTLENIADIFVHNLTLYAAGKPLDNQVSRTTGYASGAASGERLVSHF